MLMAVSCRSPVRTQIYRQLDHTQAHLYAGLLQSVNSIGDALLQLVLDGRGSKQLQVLLDYLGGSVEGICPP